MNAGVLESVWARLVKGPPGLNGVQTSQDGSPAVAPTVSRDQIQDLSPFRLLSLVEKRKKRPDQETWDPEAIRTRVREYLRHEDWRIRNIGVKLVGLIGYREMLPALLDMGRDRTPDTLLRRLFGGDYRQVGFIRRNILKTIGDLGGYSQEVKRALLEALRDPYFEVRSGSAATIRRLSDQVGIDPEIEQGLIHCLRDPSFEVVMEALLALGKVGGTGAAKPAVDLYTHRNWRVREAALHATRDLIERGLLCDAEAVEQALENLLIPCPGFKPNFPLRGVLRDLAQDLIRLHQR